MGSGASFDDEKDSELGRESSSHANHCQMPCLIICWSQKCNYARFTSVSIFMVVFYIGKRWLSVVACTRNLTPVNSSGHSRAYAPTPRVHADSSSTGTIRGGLFRKVRYKGLSGSRLGQPAEVLIVTCFFLFSLHCCVCAGDLFRLQPNIVGLQMLQVGLTYQKAKQAY